LAILTLLQLQSCMYSVVNTIRYTLNDKECYVIATGVVQRQDWFQRRSLLVPDTQ